MFMFRSYACGLHTPRSDATGPKREHAKLNILNTNTTDIYVFLATTLLCSILGFCLVFSSASLLFGWIGLSAHKFDRACV